MAKIIAALLILLPLFITSIVIVGIASRPWLGLTVCFVTLSPVLLGVLKPTNLRSLLKEVGLREIAGVVAFWAILSACWWLFWMFIWAFAGVPYPTLGEEIFAILIFGAPVILPVALGLIAFIIGKFR